MSVKGKSLYVMTPMYGGQLTVNYHSSFIALCAVCQQAGVTIDSNNIYNESLISRARNRATDSFMKESNATYACYIDADIGFDPRDVLAMMELDEPILDVPCTKKFIRWDRVQYAIARNVIGWLQQTGSQGTQDELTERYNQTAALNPADLPRIAGDFVLNFKYGETKTIVFDKPEPMRHVGTGMLMVKREVFEKFMRTYPDRWYEAKADAISNPGPIHDFFKVGVNKETREYDSEDYSFIHDCIAMGYQALLCPWIKTTHMGTHTFVDDMTAALSTTGKIF